MNYFIKKLKEVEIENNEEDRKYFFFRIKIS